MRSVRRSRFSEMSVDELRALEKEYLKQRAIDKPGAVHDLANLYRVLLRKVHKDDRDEITKKLVNNLIDYGTYMKTSVYKDEYAAEKSLEEALRYERKLPIAHYRLGFLAYNKLNYFLALTHFQQAINLNTLEIDSKYKLNRRQLYYAHLYLTNSALYIAESSRGTLEEIDNEEFEQLDYKMSPFFDVIASNELYLEQNAFMVVSKEGKRYCSKKEAEDLLDTEDILICYFGDSRNEIYYNGRSKTLSKNRAEQLRYILLYSTENRPATKLDMIDTFSHSNIPDNTFNQAMRRLRKVLNFIPSSSELIISKSFNGIPGCYYTGEIDFTSFIARIMTSF